MTHQLQTPNRVRPVGLRTSGATLERCPDGTLYVRPEEALDPYPNVLTDRLTYWAKTTPQKICIAQRQSSGEWRTKTFAQVENAIHHLAQALLNRELTKENPVAILSENDINISSLMLAGQHAGIPTAHLSPVYSLVSRDFGKLRHTMNLLTPGLVFVSDGERYNRAIESVVNPQTELVVTKNPPPNRKSTPFDELAATKPTAAVAEAHEKIQPDDVAKILFTSGSTGMPKGVINTHRMLCCNQQMIAQVFGFLQDEPPTLVDWLPWNHTFGGNHNTGIALYNGGSFYIDDGKPGPAFIAETIRNLREISPTVYFNVPKGYEDLLPALRAEPQFRENFFRHLRLLFTQVLASRNPSGTPTAPSPSKPAANASSWSPASVPRKPLPWPFKPLGNRSGRPNLNPHPRRRSQTRTPRSKLKVASAARRHPGYWRQPELTEKVFDEDRLLQFRRRSALRRSARRQQRIRLRWPFLGRLKLASGTWVSVGPLRSRILADFAPYVRDAVITGHDRDEVGMIIFADADACRGLRAPSAENDGSPAATEISPSIGPRAFPIAARKIRRQHHRQLQSRHSRHPRRRASLARRR